MIRPDDMSRMLSMMAANAERLGAGPAGPEGPHGTALGRLNADTHALREEFIRRLASESKSKARDVKMLLSGPKVLRKVYRPILRSLLGVGTAAATTGLFLTAKSIKDWFLPALRADPWFDSALLIVTAIGSATLTRFATGRWRDALEDAVIVERVFDNPTVLADLRNQIAASPGNTDAIFRTFIKNHQFGLVRKLAVGAVEHGPAMALGAWAYDAPPGTMSKLAADMNAAPTWTDRGKLILDTMWAGIVGDRASRVEGFMGHGKKFLGIR